MGLIDNINFEIEKNGGIAKYYEIIHKELTVSEPIAQKNKKHVVRYDFSTRYLIDNANIKTVVEMAKALGTNKTQILRRLKELDIKKIRISTSYQHHIQETCLIINIESGIYYPNCSEAARALNYDLRTVQVYVKERGFYKKFIKVA